MLRIYTKTWINLPLNSHKPRHSYFFRNWDTLPCFQFNHHSFLSHKNRLQYINHWSLNIKLTKFGFLSFSHDRFPLFPASRHSLQVKNTPTAATASRQNISIPADGICLWPRDPSGAGCHVSNWPVWELAQPKGLLSQGKEGGDHFPAHYFHQQWQLGQRITLHTRLKWVWGRCLRVL